MRLLLMLFIFVVGNPAFASNFDGTWTGSGKFESPEFGSISPAMATIEINQIGNMLSIESCWSFTTNSANWNICSPQDVEVRGSDLIMHGYKVGTISADRIVFQYAFADAQIEEFIEVQANGLLNYSFKSIHPGRTSLKEAFGLTR